MASKLAELVFVFYTILVIATVELTKNTSYEAFSQSPLVNIPDAVKTGSPQSQEPAEPEEPAEPAEPEEPAKPPQPAELPEVGQELSGISHGRGVWKQTVYSDDIKSSYKKTNAIILKSPFIREEACLPIEGNIGMQIDIASEIFGPFEHTFHI